LDNQKFEGNIWECACGNGAMSKVMIKNGYDVYSSDLINRDYGETGVDFLESDRQVDNIVTISCISKNERGSIFARTRGDD
jgi:2-polyprenyl-3-methyl-5-hydroxy-6-metoxy-1,4-benzoquinol methylase